MDKYLETLASVSMVVPLNSNDDVSVEYGGKLENNTRALLKVSEIIPSDYNGSRYGKDSIRIEGSMVYIKNIMELLAPFLDIEFEEK